ncbi:MAG: DUF1428 domain-containing protein [Elusimicrobiota bacterium]|nr:DUF1428 domain-containing protein [Elusimicrobiota bacterium]
MAYVDGYLIAMPKKNKAVYRRMAALGAKLWMDHGALDYKECVGDDLDIKGVASFRKLLRLKPGETAVFSYIVYRSRAHRDAVNAKVMKDPRMKAPKTMPFEFKRMFFGGFKVLVSA